MAVVHAIVAGQVARRLRGCDEIIGRDRVRGAGQRNFTHRSAKSLVNLESSADGLLNLHIEPFTEVLARNADGQRLYRFVHCLAVRGNGFVDAGAVARVVASDGFQQQGRVGEIVSQGADLIERAGEGNQAVARYTAVGRLEPNDAAQAGRLSNGTARVSAEG